MFTVRVVQQPSFGKGPQLRALAEERSRAANAAGSPHSVSQSMYSAEATFVTLIRHESLTALEAYTERNANDPAFLEFVAKLGECLSATRQELYETLVPAQVTGKVNYTLRVKYFPALGRGAELRQALEQRAATPARGTVGVGLSTQVAPEEGANFVATLLFSNLGQLELFRGVNQVDPSFRAFQAQIANLLAGPVRQELYRVLMPFPAG